MTEIEGCIRFWEAKKKEGLLDVSTAAIVDNTIRFLRVLEIIKEEASV